MPFAKLFIETSDSPLCDWVRSFSGNVRGLYAAWLGALVQRWATVDVAFFGFRPLICTVRLTYTHETFALPRWCRSH